MTVKSNVEQFKSKAQDVHTGYDYSSVRYVDTHTPVSIGCVQHGIFLQTPYSHLQGHGCPKCATTVKAKDRTMTIDQFKMQANIVHCNRYDYSSTVYGGYTTLLTIICEQHGPFLQKPVNHLSGNGCQICGRIQKLGRYDETYFKCNPSKKETPSVLYLVHIQESGDSFYKIGITTRSVNKRFSGKIQKLMPILTMQTTLYQAFRLEQHILNTLGHYKHQPMRKFNGHTECLSYTPGVLTYIQTTLATGLA
jgi:hypothetical protein